MSPQEVVVAPAQDQRGGKVSAALRELVASAGPDCSPTEEQILGLILEELTLRPQESSLHLRRGD